MYNVYIDLLQFLDTHVLKSERCFKSCYRDTILGRHPGHVEEGHVLDLRGNSDIRRMRAVNSAQVQRRAKKLVTALPEVQKQEIYECCCSRKRRRSREASVVEA